MSRPAKSTTLTQKVHGQLKMAILAGRFRPGERLPLAALAKEHGVSLSVLREAVTRLAEQELIISEPQLGFRVKPLSAEDLSDLTAVRVDIETLALRRSIARGDVAWEARVIAAHHTMDRMRPTADTELHQEAAEAHLNFHADVLAACGSPRLIKIATDLRESAELYQRWAAPFGLQEGRDAIREHRDLLDAMLDRDTERAVAVLTQHIQRTAQLLLDHADELTGDAAALPRPDPHLNEDS
ncbi:GntR family transcriptional regulator [Planotetraspora sp. GP83]|uniref:GntR family transcriptional regulator n=1 Tax=Planotetraspora sp. GP83 TaxID=3156264 RepID=UPI0035125237